MSFRKTTPEQLWLLYTKGAYQNGMGQQQEKETRQSFMAGALAALTFIAAVSGEAPEVAIAATDAFHTLLLQETQKPVETTGPVPGSENWN
jgi:hypothetical protein